VAILCLSLCISNIFCKPSDAAELMTETLPAGDVALTHDDSNCESIVVVLSWRILASSDCEQRSVSGLLAIKYDETEAALRLLPAQVTGAAVVTGTVMVSSRSHSAVKCRVKVSSEIDGRSSLGIFDGTADTPLAVAD